MMNFLQFNGEQQLDQHIYRIMPQDHVISIFKMNQNVLSQVHKWKDKFESFQLQLGGIVDGEQFGYGFKNNFVGQCWSTQFLSEAMWGIYANDTNRRYLRIRSTPRKLLNSLVDAHPKIPHDTCFIGKVEYKIEKELKAFVEGGAHLHITSKALARSLLLKRRAFRHEREVRLIYFAEDQRHFEDGLYRYKVNPHELITQIMGDPNRDRWQWKSDKAKIKAATGYNGPVKRSKIYDPPEWNLPIYKSAG
jgi:hypothetical protein